MPTYVRSSTSEETTNFFFIARLCNPHQSSNQLLRGIKPHCTLQSTSLRKKGAISKLKKAS